MKGIVVCVEYDDLLAITLPRNAAHFEKVVVVTSLKDERTPKVAAALPNVVVHRTDAFYEKGDAFNKGRAIEEGFDVLGRDGWILVHDADVLFPIQMDLSRIEIGKLYNAPRRMLEDPRRWKPNLDWASCPTRHEPNEFPGYFQLFHADDPIAAERPWYPTDWRHAGGCDSVFQLRWPREQKVYLPFEVLHLGLDGRNWHGRCTPRLDGTMPREARRRATEQQTMLHRRREGHRHGKRWGGK